MPIPPEKKIQFERDIRDNFSKVPIKMRGSEYEDSATIDVLVVKEKQFIEDPNRKEFKSQPIIIISYPAEDVPSPKAYMSEFLRETKVPAIDHQLADETIDTFETLVAGGSVEETFTITEPTVYSAWCYVNLPVGSTSWLCITLKDSSGNVIAKQTFYMEIIERPGWQKLSVDAFVPVGDLTVVLKEVAVGSNPIGVEVGKNAAGDYIVRSYSYSVQDVRGQVVDGIIQLDVIGRNKEFGHPPQDLYFIERADLAGQIANLIRDRIRELWHDYVSGVGLNYVGQSQVMNDFMDNDFMADAQVSIGIRYEEYYLKEYVILEKINIEKVNL